MKCDSCTYHIITVCNPLQAVVIQTDGDNYYEEPDNGERVSMMDGKIILPRNIFNHHEKIMHKIMPFIHKSKNKNKGSGDSMSRANYARIPFKLLDPNFGITTHNNKVIEPPPPPTTNTSDPYYTHTLNKKDNQVKRGIFSKRNNRKNIESNLFNQRASSVLNQPEPLTDQQRKMKMQYSAEYIVKRIDDINIRAALPFNISSDAVGYGAAYAAGYALAASGNMPNKKSDFQPWKVNNAISAGFASYYSEQVMKRRKSKNGTQKKHK